MIIPEMLTVPVVVTLKMRKALPPLTVSWAAPGPLSVMFLLIVSWWLVSVIIDGGEGMLKVIVSPFTASASACRNEPAPLSFVLVTINVAVMISPFPPAFAALGDAKMVARPAAISESRLNREKVFMIGFLLVCHCNVSSPARNQESAEGLRVAG